MATNAKPVYKRILLKLSGEALQGTEGFGIDASILDRMAQEIKELVELGIQVGVVIGGGNLFRGAGLAKAGMNRGGRRQFLAGRQGRRRPDGAYPCRPHGDAGDRNERPGNA